MVRRCIALVSTALLIGTGLWAQGLDTQASKDDWEEINFDFNSSVLVDGFPSLLRLAELLQANGGYHVRVEGHTDGIGSDSFNQKLGLERANTVRDFLVKYGARTGQIETISRGKAAPKVPNPNPVYSPTDVARFMNRRVVLTVTDDQGRTVGAGGAGDAIRAITNAAPPAGVADCCSEVLKRLDKLDDIAKMIKDLADQNAALRKDLDGLQQNQKALEARMNQPAPQAPAPPSATEVANAVTKQLDAEKTPKFQLLSANAGPDGNGGLTFTGKGRFFDTMGTHFGFEAQGEYYYVRGQAEGQADFGLVDRVTKHLQAGLFASFKHVNLSGNQTGGTLGEGALAVDYIFSRGRIGIFGTKGFLDNALINSVHAVDNGVFQNNVMVDSYLKIVDQAGVAATIGLWGNNYAEGNLGYLKSVTFGDHLGGTLRLIFPLNRYIALTAEGGVNETLIARGNDGRAAFGVEFGNMIRPKEYLAAEHALPMEVPRVRYEVVTKRVRNGNAAPVADAGPNQIGVPAGTIQLDGSASSDPDGDPITFQWSQQITQQGTPLVTLVNSNTARPTFTAAAGQTYDFLLVVKDSLGGQGQARVRVSTLAAKGAEIVFFTATPAQIAAGQPVTLSWKTAHANTANIGGIGNVALNGSLTVSPTQTTTYTLTARNNVNDVTSTVTVTVGSTSGSGVQLSSCTASPANISAGQSSTLSWTSTNADTVSISSGVGSAAKSGSVAVNPAQTTTYIVTAAGGGASTTCAITVTVGALPVIANFTANPATISTGQSSTLQWSVQNSTSVSISSIGTVQASGTRSVSPTVTTVYTLTATNAAGSAAGTATVTVGSGAPVIVFASGNIVYTTIRDLQLNASGSSSPAGNNPLQFYWTSRNSAARIDNPTSPTPQVYLPGNVGNYIFDLTVTDSKGNSTTRTLTVRLIGQ